MADTPPSPSNEKPVVANNCSLCRLWTLTTISLTLNVIILALIVVGAIIHHHHRHFGFAGRHGGGYMNAQSQFGGGPQFQRFSGPGGPNDTLGGGAMRGGFGPGEGGPGGMGMRGMMAPGPDGKPDPAKMTDMMLNHLSNKLILTDDEIAKIKPIIEAQVTATQKEMEVQHAAMQKQFEDTKAKIKPLLTPDQQKQLDAIPLPGQKPPPLPNAPPQPPGPPPGE